jgi:hypothetical protein
MMGYSGPWCLRFKAILCFQPSWLSCGCPPVKRDVPDSRRVLSHLQHGTLDESEATNTSQRASVVLIRTNPTSLVPVLPFTGL